MEFKHEVNSDELKGIILIKLPKFEERMNYVKEANIKHGDDGNVVIDSEGIDSFIKLKKSIEKHVIKVDLKAKASKITITSLEELGYYSEFSEILGELINVFTNGVSLGKVKGRA